MVTTCCAFGCTNRHPKDGVSFYRFPVDPERRAKWVVAVKRGNWKLTDSCRVCSEHFVDGKKSNNPLSPAYVPSIFAIVRPPRKTKLQDNLLKYERLLQQTERQMFERVHVSPAAEEQQSHQKVIEEVNLEDEGGGHQRKESSDIQEGKVDESTSPAKEENNGPLGQSDECCNFDSLLFECQRLREESTMLRALLNTQSFDITLFKDNDAKVKHFTGLPSLDILTAVLTKIEPFLSDFTILSPFQKVLLTCVKLKFDLPFQFLSYLFGVSRTTAYCTFINVIHVMNRRFVPSVVIWPDREQLRTSMPMSFQTLNKCAFIIDCFEVCIEHPKDLKARVQIYAQKTIKYLIGITPCGSISYISKGWGGRVSDINITNCCDLLENLTPGDVILADRGFNVGDSVGLYNSTLGTPAFAKGKKQLDPLDVETSHALASQRIPIERFTGFIKLKYKILQSTIPIHFLQHDHLRLTTLDKIVRVAGALTNLSQSVALFD